MRDRWDGLNLPITVIVEIDSADEKPWAELKKHGSIVFERTWMKSVGWLELVLPPIGVFAPCQSSKSGMSILMA